MIANMYASPIRLLQARLVEILWVAVGQAGYLVGVFATMKLFTHWLSQAEYGRFGLGMSLAGLAALFGSGPLSHGILRQYAPHREAGNLNVYFQLLREALIKPGLWVASISIIAASLAWPLGSPWPALIVAAGLLAIAAGIGDVLGTLATARRQRSLAAFNQGGGTWLRLFGAVLTVSIMRPTGAWALVGYGLGATLTLWPLLTHFNREQHPVLHRQHPELCAARRKLWNYVRPFLVFAGLTALSLYADRWLIQWMIGSTAVGLYFAVMQIASAPLTGFFGILTQAVQPVLFQYWGHGQDPLQRARAARLLRYSVWLAIVTVVLLIGGVALWEAPLVRLLTTPDYAQMPGLLVSGMLAQALLHLGQLLTLPGLAYQRPQIYLWPKALHALSFLAIAPILLPCWGISGATYALCASAILYLSAIIWVNRDLDNADQPE